MKTLILIVAVTITAAAVPFGVMFGQTSRIENPPKFRPSFLPRSRRI
jgi:hypothetical protein